MLLRRAVRESVGGWYCRFTMRLIARLVVSNANTHAQPLLPS
jgi:hypothetical protein